MGTEDNIYILPSSFRTYDLKESKLPLIVLPVKFFKKPLVIVGMILLFLILVGLAVYSFFK